jgi:Protein of unknown function (DUF2851).
MTEKLLQYLWQFRYFNHQALCLESGESLQIIYPGHFNTNQGPDFLEAKIKVDGTLWVGHIELHVKTTDWLRHAHQFDYNYDNVVLHVVWEDDATEKINNIPVLCLQPRVPVMLLRQYNNWMKNASFIACGVQAWQAPDITWMAWKERLLAERLQRKAHYILECLQQNNLHWEETAWWLLARNFGLPVNAEPFEAIARSLPIRLLAKHKNRLHQLEALLLGQAGLASDNEEYIHLKNKYQLQPIPQSVHFLRMRPGSFPTVRLTQLAMLVHECSHLFAYIKDAVHLRDVKKMLGYSKAGSQKVNNVIINTIVPVLFTYGQLYQEELYINKALQWLAALPAEKNNITNGFVALGVGNSCAADSQALKELKTNYCDTKRCLDCAVGNSLLKYTAGSASQRGVDPAAAGN